MLQQIEAQFPAFKQFLGLQGEASIQQFNKAMDFSHAQDGVKKLLDSFRTQFPQVVAAMDSTSGSIVDKAGAVTQALESIIHGPRSTKAMKEAATQDLQQLRQNVDQNFTQMATLVGVQSQEMASAVQAGSSSAAHAATTNFDNLQKAITQAVASGAMAADQGFKIIAQTTLQMVKLFGGSTKGLDVSVLSHTSQIAAMVSQGKAGVSGLLTAANTLAPSHATGAKVNTPSYVVGEEAPLHPEYILSTNPAYLSRNKGLWASWAKDVGIPGFKHGGYIDPIPGFSLGRDDMGVDANAPVGTPIVALGPSRMVGYQSNWYHGQPEMVFQLTGGPDIGRYWYVAEQIVPLAHMGQQIPQGGIVARYAASGTGIEIGWAANAAGTTLAQATSGYHEGQVTPAGQSFRALITGSPQGAAVGLPGGIVQAPTIRGGGAFGQAIQGALDMVTNAANLAVGSSASVAGTHTPFKGTGGSWVATAYGPPWGGIQGTGVTATGVNLKSAPHDYIVAVDPSVIPLHSKVKVWPNPFGYSGAFSAEDTGGAIKGHHIDIYDWKGRADQLGWGLRPVNVAGPFGSGGVVTANQPTLAMFGERGPETAMFIPHYAPGGVYSPTSLGLPDSSMPPAQSPLVSAGLKKTSSTTYSGTPYVSGGKEITPTTTISYSSTGAESIHTHDSVKPLTSKAIHHTLGFNPITDQIESHTTDQWRQIHATYSKQRHDASQAKKAYDFWLKQQVEDMLTIGGLPAGVVDATRRTMRTEHLPAGGTSIPLTAKSLGGMTGEGFKTVLSSLGRYLKVDTLADSINLLTRVMHEGAAAPTSRLGQVQATLIEGVAKGVQTQWTAQTKRFGDEAKVAQMIEQAPVGSTAASLGLSRTQMRAVGLSHGMITRLAASGQGSPAAYKQQLEQILNQVLPAMKSDAAELEIAIKAAAKSHNKKLKDALLAQLGGVTKAQIQASANLEQAQTQLVESVYQTAQTKLSKAQGASDLITAVQGLGAGTNLGAIGLTPQVLKAMGLDPGQLQGLVNNGDPMAAARTQNNILSGMRGTDTTALGQLLAQLPTLKGAALDTANQHVLDLSKSIADLTTQINNNLITAIKAVSQTFQDQADIAGANNDILAAIGDTPIGTSLSAQGLGPGLLQSLGIDPATAAAIQGYGPAAIQGDLSAQGNVLTPAQLAGAKAYYGAENAGIQTELGGPNSGLIGELNYDYSQLPSLTGTDRTDMLNHIRELAKTIAGLDRTMQDNTDAVTGLTNATNASTTATGQMTGSVGYAYRGQDYVAAGGMTSDSPINFPVGS